MGGSEIRFVQEAFDSNWLSTIGPNVTGLELEFSELTGCPSVALASGTAALHLGLKLLGIGPGDEVLTPTLTFAASCNPILYQQATPVFIDSDRISWNLDPQLLSDFLQKRARANRLPDAITVVHLFGQSADMDSIIEICRRYELPLLEDAAESLGAQYNGRHPGTFGDVGVYSFNGNKIITSTGGGMLVSAKEEWVNKARFWSTQARDPGVNYLHSELGYNYRMSNVLAGIARGQLEVLPLRIEQRRAVFDRYRTAFAEIPGIEPQTESQYVGASVRQCVSGSIHSDDSGRTTDDLADGALANPPQPSDIMPYRWTDAPSNRATVQPSLHTRWLSCFLIDEKEFGMSQMDLIRFLDAANIESRPVWKPMHTQKLYEGYECVGGSVAEDLNNRGICLPSSSCLTEEEQNFVIDRVIEAHRNLRRKKASQIL